MRTPKKIEIPSNFRGRFEINSEIHVRKILTIFCLEYIYKVWFFGRNLMIETIRKIFFFEFSYLFIMQCPQNVLEKNYENLFLCLSHKCKWGTHDWHRNSPNALERYLEKSQFFFEKLTICLHSMYCFTSPCAFSASLVNTTISTIKRQSLARQRKICPLYWFGHFPFRLHRRCWRPRIFPR